MFRNKKYMAWNFHLFSNLVSICCETFRNVSNFGLKHFWVCFNLFQLIYYIIYKFQCFATKNIWPGIFTFSLTISVSICCQTFRNVSKFGLSQFWVFFNLFQLIYYIIYMFQCFATKNIWPGIVTFPLTLTVSICCETFRNVSKFGLSQFWVCFNLFQLIYYIIYMFQCFATKNIWPGIFTFSLTLTVSICCETFQISDLVTFWLCFNLFQLIYYIIYMFQCFATKNIWPGIFTFSLTLTVSICCETFQISDLVTFWVCFNLFQLIYYIIYMFQCFATRNIWPGIFTFSLTLFQFVAKCFETFQSSDLVIFGSVSICFS